MYDQIALAALKVVGLAMEKFPNYEQKKVEEFHELREELHDEANKPFGVRNDKLVLVLSDQLRRYVEDFHAILGKEVV